MLDPTQYYTVYLTAVAIMTLLLSYRYSSYPDSRIGLRFYGTQAGAVILMVALCLFIGLRPKHKVFTDMSNYDTSFIMLRYREFNFNWDTTNKLFDNLLYYLASNGYAIELFFFIMAVLYFCGIYLSSRKIFPKDTLYAMVIYLGAFSTFSYATNGIKAGVAAVLFLCAVGYYKNRTICVILLLASIGFHHSMVMPVIAYVFCNFYKNTKVFLYGWFAALIIAALHIMFFQNLFAGMADEGGAGYLAVDGEPDWASFRTGFRPDFILYSSFPLLTYYYAVVKHRYKSLAYTILFNTYLLTNAVWMLCMYANFTNRIAYLSWLMLPIVLIYPFFDKAFVPNQYRKLNFVAYCHLGFTIFMQVIYYGFIK